MKFFFGSEISRIVLVASRSNFYDNGDRDDNDDDNKRQIV